MKKEDSKKIFIFIRYLILLLAMFSLPLIYSILTPITIYTLKFILQIFYNDVSLTSNIISINHSVFIQVIESCVAGSAYLLLLILNLSVSMSFKKRIYSLVLSILSFFILNLLRIIIFSLLFTANFAAFNLIHMLFWYFLSTILVVLIWIITAGIFSIKGIPIYSDIKYLYKESKK